MVGTANFVNPVVPIEIIEGLKAYMKNYGLTSLKELTGALELN